MLVGEAKKLVNWRNVPVSYIGMVSKSTAIFDSLAKKITSGEYNSGDRLPSESELCAEFAVSRGSVRSALAQMEAVGLIYKRKGGGSYVKEQDSLDYLGAQLPNLRFHTKDFKEILEIRGALDTLSIQTCLLHHEDNDYSRLEKIVSAMEKKHRYEEFFELDRDFHTIISELSRNRLLHRINLMVWDLLRHCPKRDYLGGFRFNQAKEHRKILDAIRSCDSELAVLYTQRHLKNMIRRDIEDEKPATDVHRWNPWLSETL